MNELEFTDDDLAGLDFEHLSYETADGICVITVERPEALNALNGELLLELGLAFDIAATDPEVRALIITGSGRAFIAGADINELANIGADVFQGRDASLAGQDLMNTLASLPVPVIAALNGFTLGGGLELALAADLRVASHEAQLGLPEVGLGLIPGYGGTQRLPRLIGMSRALDLILTGRRVPADEALSLGLVNRVSDNALATARELAQQMIANGPIAVGVAKEAVVRGLGTTLSQGLEIDADLFAFVTTTEDMTEGTSAFLEKRKPGFTGN
jgi:enoyl-CoA hydratase